MHPSLIKKKRKKKEGYWGRQRTELDLEWVGFPSRRLIIADFGLIYPYELLLVFSSGMRIGNWNQSFNETTTYRFKEYWQRMIEATTRNREPCHLTKSQWLRPVLGKKSMLSHFKLQKRCLSQVQSWNSGLVRSWIESGSWRIVEAWRGEWVSHKGCGCSISCFLEKLRLIIKYMNF